MSTPELRCPHELVVDDDADVPQDVLLVAIPLGGGTAEPFLECLVVREIVPGILERSGLGLTDELRRRRSLWFDLDD
ncbi:hypothetical protein [Natrinema caseinilyticum]|uniref:hypothetical protein n=1 Tax=Natrinema caseinilyticum TaxID=2961570 RepID=UPI0020C58997|nr:hypothetical protein [Natrinema caseinilyticum]